MGINCGCHNPATLPPGKTHWIGGWVGPRADMYGCGKSRHTPPPTEIRSSDRPASSESLYRLRCVPGKECLLKLLSFHKTGKTCRPTAETHRIWSKAHTVNNGEWWAVSGERWVVSGEWWAVSGERWVVSGEWCGMKWRYDGTRGIFRWDIRSPSPKNEIEFVERSAAWVAPLLSKTVAAADPCALAQNVQESCHYLMCHQHNTQRTSSSRQYRVNHIPTQLTHRLQQFLHSTNQPTDGHLWNTLNCYMFRHQGAILRETSQLRYESQRSKTCSLFLTRNIKISKFYSKYNWYTA
jgi:hypothetical protein